MLRIPGLRFRAVCDIWTEYNQKRVVNTLKKYKFEVNGYEDYREMLDKEKELDAVVIATPDFWHAEHTIDCLKAGMHVYCEKEMSNTLEGARSMVLAARRDGEAPPDRAPAAEQPALPALLREAARGGRSCSGAIATVNGQWNRAVSPDIGWPEALRDPRRPPEAVRLHVDGAVPELALVQGPRAAARSWTSGRTRSTSTTGSSAPRPPPSWRAAGIDYYDRKTHEWYDTVMAIYEYETPAGPVRAFYQTRPPTAARATSRASWATRGRSSSPNPGELAGFRYRDPHARHGTSGSRRATLTAPKVQETKAEAEEAVLDVREIGRRRPSYRASRDVCDDPYHQPHLENFFDCGPRQGEAQLPGRGRATRRR